MSEAAVASPEIQAQRASIFGSVPPPAPQQTAAAPQTTEPVTVVQEAPAEQVSTPWFKEHFGLDSQDAVKQQWTEMQALKAAPPKVEYKDLEFPDEISKKLYQNIKEGKRAEVRAFLEGQDVVNELDKKTPEQILKLHIKMQNPLFTDKHVNEEYDETYNLDEDSVEPEKLERQRLKLEQKKQNDLKQAQTFFEQYKSKIELPDISPKAAAVDPDYEEFKTILQKEQDGQRVLDETLSKITGNEVSYSYQFNDEANKLAFDVSYSPDENVLNVAKKAASNIFEFVGKNFRSEDGSPQTTKLLSHLAILADLPKYTAEVAKQAINAERSRYLRQGKNISNATQRNYNVGPETDVQRTKGQIF